MKCKTADKIDLETDLIYNLTGAKLAKTTQVLAYKGIINTKNVQQQNLTKINLKNTQNEIDWLNSIKPTEENIWKSLWYKNISKKISDFLWETIHDTQRCRTYWETITSYKDWVNCDKCEDSESIRHILLKCTSEPCKMVWELTERLWLKKYETWPAPFLETILSVSLVTLKNAEGFYKYEHTARLYRILILKGAHLVCKMHYECKFTALKDGKQRSHLTTEIYNWWKYVINKRLFLDNILVSEHFGRNGLVPELVLQTWNNLLQNERNLFKDWICENRILVGIQ